MKCGSRSGEQQLKIKVISSEHKNLLVSLPYLRVLVVERESLQQMKRGSALSVLISTTIFVITVVKMRLVSPQQILSSVVMTDVVVDKSTDNSEAL